MVNLLAGRAVVPELLQQDVHARTGWPRRSPGCWTMRRRGRRSGAAFRDVLASLAPPQGRPSEAAAAEVLAVLEAAQLRP